MDFLQVRAPIVDTVMYARDLPSKIGRKLRNRPDPPPPAYTTAELAAFAGRFESRDRSSGAELAVHERRLTLELAGERTELALLDRVYVPLRLAADRHQRAADKGEDALRARGPWSLRKLLELDPAEHSWVSRRWVVLSSARGRRGESLQRGDGGQSGGCGHCAGWTGSGLGAGAR